jgi:hypothetical protein
MFAPGGCTSAPLNKQLNEQVKDQSSFVHFALSRACTTVDDIPADVFGPDPDISNPPAELPPVKEKPAKEKTASKKGTRFNLETLPEQWALAAKAIRPDVDPRKVFEEFRDYWIARPGAGGCKLDWAATWRNWVRKISDADARRMNSAAQAYARRESNPWIPKDPKPVDPELKAARAIFGGLI